MTSGTYIGGQRVADDAKDVARRAAWRGAIERAVRTSWDKPERIAGAGELRGVLLGEGAHRATGPCDAQYDVAVTIHGTLAGQLIVTVDRIVTKRAAPGEPTASRVVSVGVATCREDAMRLLRNKRKRIGPASAQAWGALLAAVPALGY